jgi:hypothetical protein
MATLHTLPAELILAIFDHLDPGSHLNFALVSRYIAHHSKDILSYHRHCHSAFRTRSISVNNNTARTLLETLLNDKIAAWHLRQLGIIEVRTRAETATPDHDHDHYSSHREINSQIAETFPHLLHSEHDLRIKSADQDFGLYDWSLAAKEAAIVPLLCPQLQFLSLGCSGLISVVRNPDQRTWTSTAGFIAQVILSYHAGPRTNFTPDRMWCQPLRTLKEVALHGETGQSIEPQVVVPFFLLPSIAAVHVRNLSFNPYGGSAFLFAPRRPWSPGTSTVQHLYLDGAILHQNCDYIQIFITTSRSLRSVFLKDCSFENFGLLLQKLSETHGDRLDTLIYGGRSRGIARDDDDSIEGLRWDCLTQMKALRILTIDVLDIIAANTRRTKIERLFRHESPEQFIQRFYNTIPRTVEVLILQDTPVQRLNDVEMRRVGDALMRLVTMERCPKLSAIYADNFESAMRDARTRWGMPTDGAWLSDTKTFIEENGISFYAQQDIGATNRFLGAISHNRLRFDGSGGGD